MNGLFPQAHPTGESARPAAEDLRALDGLLVETSAKRLFYWVVYLAVGLVAVTASAAVQGTLRPFRAAIWASCLVVLLGVAAYRMRLHSRRLAGLRDWHPTRSSELQLFALATAIALCWSAGIFALDPQPQPGGFIVAKRTFIWLTAFGHVITVVLLSASWKTTLAILVPSFYIPAIYYLSTQTGAAISMYWLSGQIVTYVVVTLFLHFDQRRILWRQIFLERERERADDLSRQRKHLLAAVSHDLRNPLTAASARLSLLRGSFEDRERFERNCDVIAGQFSLIENIIRSALDLSRLELGHYQSNAREIAARDLIEEVASSIAFQAGLKQISVRTRKTNLVVRSDKEALFRILSNLAENAIKYSNRGSDILIGAQVRGAEVRFSVLDRGIGIPSEVQRKIFKDFYQVHNPERDPNKGFGLGLTIADRLAKLLGHSLEVESTVGRGSRFSVRVPFSGRMPSEYSAVAPMPQPVIVPALGGMAVVLVEDNEVVRTAMTDLLSSWECHVIAGEDFEEVSILLSTALGDEEPDVLVCDYRLRSGTGLDVIKRFRALYPNLPALMWSGNTDVDTLKMVSESGIKLFTKAATDPEATELAKELIAIHEKNKTVSEIQ